MNSRGFGFLAGGVLLAAALGPTLYAQTVSATLRGKVADEQGSALPGAIVAARNVETNMSRSVTTGSLGTYFLPGLPAGTYEITATLSQFSPSRRTGVVLRVAQEGTVDFALKVGGLQEEVTVAADAPILETTRSTIGSIINNKQLDELPVIDRDFSSLAKLSPA